MQMIRTFHSVGQGAFYTECFENGNNIVYDCGTLSGIEHLEQEIASQFEKGDTIDAVFISHLHEDHCNGLEMLLDRCNVKKIFLPYLTEDETVMSLIRQCISHGAGGFVWELIENPIMAVRRMEGETEVVLVYPSDAENNDIAETPLSLSDTLGVIHSGMEVGIAHNKGKWVYVPFHYKHTSRVKQMKDELTTAGLSFPKNGEEVKQLWENHPDIIKEIYEKKLSGKSDHNGHSLVVYSGPSNDYTESDTWAYSWYGREIPAGCLYFGDYKAKATRAWAELERFIEPYRSQIYCCQIPHHGAASCYHPKLKQIAGMFVISCGYGNGFHHPHSSVLRDLMFSGYRPYIVTEMPGSRFFYLIDGWDR